MPIFQLKNKAQATLFGDVIGTTHEIVEYRGRALKLAVIQTAAGMDVRRVEYWFPLSQVTLIKPASYPEDSPPTAIDIPQWLWDKRTPAKPAGVQVKLV